MSLTAAETTRQRAAPEPAPPSEKSLSTSDEKSFDRQGGIEAATVDADSEEVVLSNERDIATHVISVDDDPNLNPWTFRAFFLGIGLSAFGGVLAEIYYFKPQTVLVSLMFLAVISYVLGVFMETVIPRRGLFRYLNPGPFNKKENAFVVIMASASANSALGTEVLAVQRSASIVHNIKEVADEFDKGFTIISRPILVVLQYHAQPWCIDIPTLLLSTTWIWDRWHDERHVYLEFVIEIGIHLPLPGILLYPSKMLYPGVLPLLSMFDALYEGGMAARKKLRVFYFVFAIIFFWELFPEWIFPLLTGFSIICLAAPNNAAVSRVFGGTNGNEGLGLLSICFDWQYISTGVNPMAIPLKAQFSNFLGYILCIIFFWELFPEWIFPLLTGFSIICLAAPSNAAVSRVFGGSNGNEGLGLLSICFDWQYISGGVNPMTIPLKAQFSSLLGYILCMVVFVAVYYNNIWKAQNFPFVSPQSGLAEH
ncbi:hypothetical protein AZE42_08545 [Rhizopogon vesiculosus]|uniref:OPT superfamily oligopeptide transporter n=1 Tax=Rhizopogon vesiculosus TaxID=180088 RepID=A0A1J8Q6U0_9AGAM|nr:hypothetical protein AZE42_08545 [Rhizopogon vesiculosus]